MKKAHGTSVKLHLRKRVKVVITHRWVYYFAVEDLEFVYTVM